MNNPSSPTAADKLWAAALGSSDTPAPSSLFNQPMNALSAGAFITLICNLCGREDSTLCSHYTSAQAWFRKLSSRVRSDPFLVVLFHLPVAKQSHFWVGLEQHLVAQAHPGGFSQQNSPPKPLSSPSPEIPLFPKSLLSLVWTRTVGPPRKGAGVRGFALKRMGMTANFQRSCFLQIDLKVLCSLQFPLRDITNYPTAISQRQSQGSIQTSCNRCSCWAVGLA